MTLLETIYQIIWGPPLIAAVIGLGIYLTIVLRGVQFRCFTHALSLLTFRKSRVKRPGDIKPIQSLLTNLAGTLGIGNLAGVATAFSVGGVGSLFWMWVSAVIGMATLYSESLLAVKYREVDENGEMSGGPMYVAARGLKSPALAAFFASSGALAAFGGGNMIQANSVADVMQSVFSVPPLITGFALLVLTAAVLLGGIKSIGKVAVILVPVMGILYLGTGLLILSLHLSKIPSAFLEIVTSAFTGQAAFGGFVGSSMVTALQVGVCRGVMTTEAGLGTAGIAAAAARTDSPEDQGLISMTACFFSTIIMCTMTGLVLTVTGAFGQPVNGASMTVFAFQSSLPYGGEIVAVALLLFAVTTLLAWAYYGERCLEYLLGTRAVVLYRVLFCLITIPGCLFDLHVVWRISDITNGLMVIPNVIVIGSLAHVVAAETTIKTVSTEVKVSG